MHNLLEFKDLLGQPLQLYDYVVFTNYYRDTTLKFGQITKITPKFLIVKPVSHIIEEEGGINLKVNEWYTRRIKHHYTAIELLKVEKSQILKA
jgi:hypothetical protein